MVIGGGRVEYLLGLGLRRRRWLPWGPGMCQLWIDTDDDDDNGLLTLLPAEAGDAEVLGWRPVLSVELDDGRPAVLAHKDDERLRRIAAFDVVINNADRKGGHLLV